MDGSFEIVLQKSGRTLQVPPNKSILETLLDAGFDVSFSCQQGICGTCETKVLAGIPDHRDMFLNEDEQDSNALIMLALQNSDPRSRSLRPDHRSFRLGGLWRSCAECASLMIWIELHRGSGVDG